MVRIFSHYVSAKTALLFAVEALILTVSVYAGAAVFLSKPGDALAIAYVSVSIFPVAALFSMTAMGLYQQEIWGTARTAQIRVVAALGLSSVLAEMAFYAWNEAAVRPGALIIATLLAFAGIKLVREVFYRWSEKSVFKERLLVLGTGARVVRFATESAKSRSHEVVSYVAMQDSEHFVPAGQVRTLAPGETLLSVAENLKIDRIVIAIRDRRNGGLPIKDLLECRMKGIKITELPSFYEREFRQVLLESINPSWMVLGDGFNAGQSKDLVKRVFDVLVSLLLLLLTLPLMLFTAICISLESKGPLLYKQERVGQGGRPFTILKFRSMRTDAEQDGKPRWAALNDDRTTRIGRIIRKLRIDELPQIFNVIRGEMSFVGPRPERPFFVDKLLNQIPYYALRHGVKPGITGWAQVCFPYGSTMDDVIEKLQHDLYYLKNHSLFLDFMILFATVEVVLWGKGAR